MSLAQGAPIPVEIVTQPVYINGVCIDSQGSPYPLLLYEQIVYLPLTWELCRFLGLESNWSAESGLSLARTGASNLPPSPLRINPVGFSLWAEPVFYPVSLGGEQLDVAGAYPWLNYAEVTYMPLTWEVAVERCEWLLRLNPSGLLEIISRPLFVDFSGDLHAHLAGLLKRTLLSEYGFVAMYSDTEGEIWLSGEMQPEFLLDARGGVSRLQLEVTCPSYQWHRGVELFSSYRWQIPLTFSGQEVILGTPQYSQAGGRLPAYAADTSFAATLISQVPLLIFDEAFMDTAAHWSATEQLGSYGRPLRLGGSLGIQSVVVTLNNRESGKADTIASIQLQGTRVAGNGERIPYQLLIQLSPVQQGATYTMAASAGSFFLPPIALSDGGLIMLSNDGQIKRTDRLGGEVWSYQAAPLLSGAVCDPLGNLYVWSYQRLWCLSPYGRLLWQRTAGVRSLQVEEGMLLVSQHVDENIRWEVLESASGWQLFLFPEEVRQVMWHGSGWFALQERELAAFSQGGALLWQKSLALPLGSSGWLGGTQYHMLAANRFWCVVLQQSMSSNRVLFYDLYGNLQGESPLLSRSCTIYLDDYGAFAYENGSLYRWSPATGLQWWRGNLKIAPLFLEQGGFIALVQESNSQSLQLVDAANRLQWQQRLPWGEQFFALTLGAAGRILLLSDTMLLCYSSQGELLWQQPASGSSRIMTSPPDSAGHLYTLWSSQLIYVVDERGRLRWSYSLK